MTNKKRRIAIICWPSWSGKTTIQEKLIDTERWVRPLNCTTREARWDYELDEYIFLTKEQFFFKLDKWDFLEHTNYWWNWYWILNCYEWKDDRNIILILDPVGREMASEFFVRKWIEFETYFLEITPEEQEKRMIYRWDRKDDIVKRKRDFKWFFPTPSCKILSWNNPVECLIKLIDNE